MWRRRFARVGLVPLILACDARRVPAPDSTAARDTVAAVALIDSTIPPAVAGEGGWNYHESATADLTGDTLPERVVLTARVELYRGRPAWDDGQPWQVYVESADGRRTYLYAQRLQLGTLAMRLTLADGGRRAAIVLIEHLPDRLRLIEAQDTGSGLAAVVRFERALDPRGETASPRFR
ncbi:MAG TPA: hypothetical protein VLE53_13770 [Gemmatimonadaceae bacterium]|nr:hypothetical protein [Gemmatimonadaceae bacterium]